MSYCILQGDDTNEAYCQIWKYPGAMPHIHRPVLGVPLASEYPEGLSFSMAPEVPATRIADIIPNTLGYLLVSARVKELLSQHATEPIEFLPFTLLNQKGRVASKDCYITNVLGTRDWADIERSMGARITTPEGERQFEHLRRLYLKDDLVDPEVNLFRISAMPKVILVREDLKALMEAAGVTGAVFHALGTKVDIR
ncbi:imm11 family protein [Archangium violaceum]|uniref:imm11 family protein n=1 Tax=Archangium violaceum TaxID=83451 RepID=UPI0036DDB7A7